jgi:hypothetical protein
MAEELGRSLEQLTATIQEQNKELKQKDTLKELDQSIGALEKSGTENSARLRETLTQIQVSLNSASNEEQMELARQQLEELQGLAGTEEENREAARRQEEANEFLSKIVSGIDGLADAYDKQLDALKPSGGLLAGLGAAALLFMDPQTLFAGVKAAIDGVFAIVDSIKMFLDGDFSEGLALLGDNIGAVSAIIGTVAILFGGRIIRLVSSMVKGVQGIIKGVTKVGGFIARLGGRFGGLAKIFGRLFLPFTIITGAIATIQGFIDGFKEGGIIGGIEGGVKGLFDTLVAWPLDLLKDGVAWILGKFGFTEAEAALDSFSFSDLIDDLIGGVFNMVKGAVAWVGELFTDPKAALTTLWNGIVGEGGLVDMIFAPIDKAIAWVQGLFNWGDPDLPFDIRGFVKLKAQAAIDWVKGLFTWASEGLSEGWTNLTDFVSNAWTSVKTWITDKFTFVTGLATEGWTNLSSFVSNKFTEAKDWFMSKLTFASDLATEGWTNLKDFALGKFTEAKDWFMSKLSFASDMATEGWTNLKDFASSKFTAVKEWFTGLFSWASEGLSEGWTNLTDFVKGKWTATKEWFTGMFSWSSSEEDKGVIQQLFDSTIEKVKSFFTDLFDFLPSFEEIKNTLTGILPDWMKPDTVEEQRQSLLDQIAEQQAEIAAGDNRDYLGRSREGIIEDLQAQLNSLPQANEGGFVNAPASGTPVMLHGQEIITPLDSPQGKVLMAINQLMNAKAEAGAGEYGGMGGPMIVQGGSSGPSNSNNSTNVSTSNYTIQQGITPDDFLKRDFLNFSY